MKLANKLHISDVELITKTLHELLDSSQRVVIDISEVEQIDTACFQALCSLQKSLAITSNQIEWSGESLAFSNAAKLLGVSTFLNL